MDNIFLPISDKCLEELLALTKTIYHNDAMNTKNPDTLLLCNMCISFIQFVGFTMAYEQWQ